MIKIVWSRCGKYAVYERGDAAASATTATFIRQEGRRLAREIQEARGVWLRTKQVRGVEPNLDLIGEQFPQIWTFCTADDVLRYVVPGGAGDYRRRTALQATNEILQQLLPTASPDYIQRKGRKTKN